MTIINRTLLSAATSACAVGFLTMPAAAHALPPIPLASFCDSWEMPAGTFVINQDNNIVVEMEGWDGTDGAGKHIEYHLNFGLFGPPDVTPGTVTNGVIEGNMIHFKADWDAHAGSSDWNEYTGTIDENGNVHGTTHNNDQMVNAGNKWGSVGPLTCVPPPGVPWQPKVVTS